MSYFRVILYTAFLSLLSADTFASDNPDATTCQSLLVNPESMPVSLISLLGDWDSCKTTHFKQHGYGIDQTLTAQWNDVTLTVKFHHPETAIYIVETKSSNVLTWQWYEKSRRRLVPSFFDMDWETDLFPGPTSEHYMAKDEGTNGQIWIERDENGSVRWMRFSYAL